MSQGPVSAISSVPQPIYFEPSAYPTLDHLIMHPSSPSAPPLPVAMAEESKSLLVDSEPAPESDVLVLGTFGRAVGFDLTVENAGKATQTVSGKLKWVNNMPGCGYSVVSVQYFKGVMYTSLNGRVRAMSPETGAEAWIVQPPRFKGFFVDPLQSLVVADDGVFLGGNGYVVCLNRATGAQLWEANLIGTYYYVVTLLLHGPLLLAASNGILYAFSRATGEIVWKSTLPGTGYAAISMVVHTNRAHGSFHEETVIVGTNGYIQSLNLANGAMKRTYNLKGTAFNPVALKLEGDLLFCSTSGEVRALHARTFEQIWLSNLPKMGYSNTQSILLHNGNVLVGMNAKVCCLRQDTGEILWRVILPNCRLSQVTLSVFKGVLLAGSMGYLCGLDAASGTVVWRDPLKGLGLSYITFGSRFDCTDYSSTTILQSIEQNRKNQRKQQMALAPFAS